MRRKTLLLIGTLIPFVAMAARDAKSLKLMSLFSDHMVLQRNMAVPVWGWAKPGSDVTVSFKGQRVSGVADKTGKWQVKLAALKTDATPAVMKISSNAESVTIRDILVGEVWLCSGQSNMEMTVSSGANYARERAAAVNPLIRHFRVKNRPDAEAGAQDVNGKWMITSPETVGCFSATAYFFGRELAKALNAPIGLVNASVGGTPIEAWMARDVLDKSPTFAPFLKQYQDALKVYPEKKAAYERMAAPYNELKADLGKKADSAIKDTEPEPEKGWNLPGYNDNSWKPIPKGISRLWRGPSVMWCRFPFKIPAAWAGKELEVDGLYVGPRICGQETVFFNGELIHEEKKHTGYHSIGYTIPGKRVKAGDAVLALKIRVDRKAGALSAVLKIGPEGAIPIKLQTDTPRYRITGDAKDSLFGRVITRTGGPPMGPSRSNAPASLFNAYIKPLIPYAIRGVIWYQGESNEKRADQYREALSALITSWRADWGEGDFPFLIVQLTAYGKPSTTPGSAPVGRARIREAQTETAKNIANADYIVTIDIGDILDFHPKNKQDVGKRLALLARSMVHGENLVYSGPRYQSMKVEGDKIRLRFNNIGGGLFARDGRLGNFAIAGKDQKFVWANAKIVGDEILVWNDSVPAPTTVWYAWANHPAETGLLFNKDGLPATPFRTQE